MDLVLHQEVPDDGNLRQQWNALVQEMERPEIFYTYEWALAVSRTYGALRTPLLILGYARAQLVGVAALATGNSQRSFFLADATADYCDFVSRPESRSEFVSRVFNELRRLKMPDLVVANLPVGSVTNESLGLASAANGYRLFARPAYRCTQADLSYPGQRELVKQSLHRKQIFRQYLKKMSAVSPVAVRHLKSWADIVAALQNFEQAHIKRFQNAGRVSNFAGEERRMFLAELAKLLSVAGWMTLSCLMVGEQPVAWNYGFEFGGSWFWYQPTFDENFARYSPGLCLLAKIIEEACDRPDINRVDLGLGEETYKQRFGTATRQTQHVTLTTSTTRRLRETVRYHAASAIKSSHWLEHYVRQLRSRVSAGAGRA